MATEKLDQADACQGDSRQRADQREEEQTQPD